MTPDPYSPNLHIMAKPTGAACNLNCDYCFFLKKSQLYPNSRFRMTDEVMESYIRQSLETQRSQNPTIAWQGGEPTLMGLDFFRRSVEVERKYLKPGTSVENTIQTNGILIDEEWCRFLRDNNFLVGVSLDGPKELHDVYRRDKAGESVFDKVLRAVNLMQDYGVMFNILCTVNAANGAHGLDVYRYFRDELGAQFIQLIPVVERNNETGFQEGTEVTERSIKSEQYGRFLIEIFDEWVRNDVGRIFVLTFDGVLASWLTGQSSLCIFRPTCGDSLTMEHNGDLYACDHYVEPNYLLGNILQTSVKGLANTEKQRAFGRQKSELLPRCCRECRYLFACHGECPKNRIARTVEGEEGLNYLCSGLKAFFQHTEQPMRIMADLLKRGQYADGVMKILASEDRELEERLLRTGPNEMCPCGSGIKRKKCEKHQRIGGPNGKTIQWSNQSRHQGLKT